MFLFSSTQYYAKFLSVYLAQRIWKSFFFSNPFQLNILPICSSLYICWDITYYIFSYNKFLIIIIVWHYQRKKSTSHILQYFICNLTYCIHTIVVLMIRNKISILGYELFFVVQLLKNHISIIILEEYYSISPKRAQFNTYSW